LKRTTKCPVQNLLARRKQWRLKRWLSHAESFSHKGNRSGEGLIDCQVGNEKEAVGLIECQVGRGDIPDFQMGNEEEMTLVESSLVDEEEAEEKPHSFGDLRRTVSRVNGDDEKLKIFVAKKEDHRTVLIIGGVEIFLPSRWGEASISIAEAMKGHQAETVVKEEEQILMSVPTGECPVEFLTWWEFELKALEDWLDNPEPEDGF
jgi:hypothetical protein